ncbi:ATP-binding protein [Motilimonas sp. KMU-193]|uniref:sensor histidine kinase n=1 Tax=Motilimonas sp. KMU-193 TaxID=3388668 RepID=UPI00396B05E6
MSLQKQDQVNTLHKLEQYLIGQGTDSEQKDHFSYHGFHGAKDQAIASEIQIFPVHQRENPLVSDANNYFASNPNSPFFEWHGDNQTQQTRLVQPIRLTEADCWQCHNQTRIDQRSNWQLNDIAAYITIPNDLDHLEQQAARVRKEITVIILPFIALMMICALLNYRRTQQNVTKLLNTAKDITQGNLHRRVGISGDDELARLGTAMDIMLDTLEQTQAELMASEQNFRQASGELKELNLELETRVFQRTDALNSALNSLQETQAELIKYQGALTASTLVAGIAHDINNPLGIALTAVTYLSEESVKIKEKVKQNSIKRSEISHYINQVDESSNIIENNLRQAALLVKSFKDMTINQCQDEYQVINFLDFFNCLFISLSPELKKANVKYQLDIDDTLSINTHPSFLSQVFTNLVLNSIRHGFKDQRDGIIKLHVQVNQQQFLITYEDNGCGVEQEVQEKMFSPFFTTQKALGGSGLGLNMVKELIKQRLAGEIEVFNVSPHGLGYRISLPSLEPEQAE